MSGSYLLAFLQGLRKCYVITHKVIIFVDGFTVAAVLTHLDHCNKHSLRLKVLTSGLFSRNSEHLSVFSCFLQKAIEHQ